jgi:hypothetical protein
MTIPRINGSILAIACIVVLWIPGIVFSQNVDVQAERASLHNAQLNALANDSPIDAASVWPVPLEWSKTHGESMFQQYTNSYYFPLVDSNDASAFFITSPYRFHLAAYGDSLVRTMLDAHGMLRTGISNADNSHFLVGRLALRSMGSIGDATTGRLSWMMDLSNGAKLLGTFSSVVRSSSEFALSRRFAADDSTFFDSYTGYVQYQLPWMRIRYGRERLQWGFSTIGNLVHSIDAPMLDGLLIDIPYKSVRFSVTHSAANDVDTAGVAVPGKYVATHRLQVTPVSWLSASVSDMIVYWDRSIDLAYLNPLAFFVSAGLGTEERNRNDNSLLAVDVAARVVNGGMIYAALVVDDLNYTSLFDSSQAGNNNKFAFQIGAQYALQGSMLPLHVAAEYVRVTPFTYSHRSLNASYTQFGSPLGYSIQPNSHRLALQSTVWFSARTYLRIDIDYTEHGENLLDSNGRIVMGEDPRFPGSGVLAPIGNVGGDVMRGDGDFLVGNSFLRGNVSTQRQVQLWLSAEWMPNVFTDVRVGYVHRSGGNVPVEHAFASFELRLGY